MSILDSMRWKSRSRLSARNMRRLMQEVERYERIFKGSHGYGFMDWDLNTKYMFWDGGFWSYLGYDARDLKRINNPDTFLDHIHPEDRDYLQHAINRHIRFNSTNEVHFRVRKKHGGFIWAEVRVESTRNIDGRVLYVSGIVFDITRTKMVEDVLTKSQERHARVLAAANDGVWEWAAETGAFHFSLRCWEHLGFDEHDDEVSNESDSLELWRSRIHQDDLPLFDKTLNDHFTNNEAFDVEYRILGKRDDWVWVRARGQMHYEEGKPWRMSGTNMDITELKAAEERVLAARDLAETANKAKSDFLSGMSHELRTPLNAILGFTQLFDLDTNLTEDQRDNINEIKRAGELLLQLVGDVLDLSKIESGKMHVQVESIDPHNIIMECLSLVQTQADARAITIDVLRAETAPDAPKIAADRRRFKQIMLNLLSNAIKYNVIGGGIRISTRMLDDRICQISVADDGKGISEALQSSVFQPFNRLSAEGTHVEGTGVGLVISKRLVEQMGGVMGFTSLENKGSNFWFQLPLATTQALNDLSYHARHDVDHSETQLAKDLTLHVKDKKKILYVEDSIPNQRLMQQILSRYPQLELTIVGEGFSGLYEARTNTPDLIILDINLPGMSGIETLDIMRRDTITKNIPVVALSANAMMHDIETGINIGFDYYLTKPLQLEELIKIFNTLFA